MQDLAFCHLKVTDIDFPELMALIDDKIKKRESLSITRLSIRTFLFSLWNKKLRDAILQTDIVLPTGTFLYCLVKKTYPHYSFRLEDTKDLVTPLLKEYHCFPVNFVFLGGSAEGLIRFTVNIKKSFPELKILGAYPKLILEQRPEDAKTILRKSEPHIFFLGKGAGEEEVWYQENKAILPKTVTICVNRHIDAMCEEIEDVPYRYKMKNREFLYILSKKPYRIFDSFIWLFIWVKWLIFKRKLKKKG